ncbi:MAG: hypothetical protein CO184_00965 [Candidatus Zambryskibacteria bacterium CG_4_9_14_3_um_filter_40_16]|uniref:Uncharacterized protein n=1 Tax=Candidatus Zambryskibacteria bacterium CG_4_9_14_3_um_filter_40_16 TaxID=1975111 RepID=A0A2M7WUT6_9BACT|nr:MAG: hypothetical protein CO184_00965 [Candidatus Zambryskibacteria bacterium CG_4_9_14_3_um_filter_40_16]
MIFFLAEVSITLSKTVWRGSQVVRRESAKLLHMGSIPIQKDFQGFIDKHARIGRMPTIEFAVDWGEKNRQKIDFLSGGS